MNEFGDLVFDVYHGPHRRAWGLKDEATARRWIARLAASVAPEQAPITSLPADEPREAGAEEGQEAEDPDEPTTFTPRRVWWNEA